MGTERQQKLTYFLKVIVDDWVKIKQPLMHGVTYFSILYQPENMKSLHIWSQNIVLKSLG